MRSKITWLIVTVLAIAAFTAIGPAERALGSNVRVVYLHGAWVWTAMVSFIAAGSAGLAGLVLRRSALHDWSRALGRTGLLFWITYLPLSMWAMQTNWNGLFLAEPRWRLGLVFAAGGLLLQAGVALISEPAWASAGNLLYLLTLGMALNNTEQVMHPASPILGSDSWRIQLFFVTLILLCLLAAWQVAGWWLNLERRDGKSLDARALEP